MDPCRGEELSGLGPLIISTEAMSTSNPGTPDPAYHSGMRQLQDRCDTRKLADRLDEKLARTAFTTEDRTFIESRPLFFLATADASGRPDCSYKGGAPGFVRVTDVDELAFPSYDGNGMFRSLGNVLVNPAVALLFIDFERPNRLRVNGSARVVEDDPLLGDFPGAQLVVRVRAARIFPNCPRYIHRMTIAETSPYVPRADYTPPIPKWKRFDEFADVLARNDPARSTQG
jgi:predicted pyridoxine 5'-phosphate oxidase superfamily flavin-nucleotide-binding protein